MSGTIIIIYLGMIVCGILLSLLRLFFGPTASDRAVAVDTITTTIVGMLVILSYVFQRYVYLDVALLYSLLAFVGLCAIARFLERGF